MSPQAERSAVVVSTAATVLLLASGWALAQMLVLGAVAQERAQATLYDDFRGQLAAATAPTGPVVEVGKPVALLRVPRVGIEQVVVEGTASGDLLRGPGHQRNTVLPGQVGDRPAGRPDTVAGWRTRLSPNGPRTVAI